MARPGSEYTNVANTSSSRKATNPSTGIRIHRHNPKGVLCENPVCIGLLRSLTHDREHCLQPGGGMEGKAPWAQKAKTPRRDVSASASEAQPPNTPAPAYSPPAPTAALATEFSHHQNLSFAVIEELKQDYSHLALRSTTMILDSGTTPLSS